MKKVRIIAIALTVSLLITSVAYANEQSVNIETKDQRINGLISELNQIAAQEAHILSDPNAATLYPLSIEKLALRERTINAELEMLGVTLVDPNDSETVSRLNAIVGEAEANNYCNESISTKSTPDISEIAALYNVYETTGTYTVDGIAYDVLTIHVTHDSAKDGIMLHEVQQHTLPLVSNGRTWEEFITYNVSFGVDMFVGTLPWESGSALSYIFGLANDDYADTAIVSTHGESYHMTFNSTSAMVYYYVRMPNDGWAQCGSSVVNFQLARHDVLSVTVGSTPVNDYYNSPSRSIPKTESHSVNWYLRDFFNSGTWHDCTMGMLPVYGYFAFSNNIRPAFVYTPEYCDSITDLV